MKGLFLRDGIWHIDKVINKSRICRSTQTSDYDEACDVLRSVLAKVPGKYVEPEWDELVQSACLDSQSWLRKMPPRMKARARKKGIDFALTLPLLKRIALETNGRCSVSGLKFDLDAAERGPYRPSIDRIDSSKGYTFENCRLVCYSVNIALNQWGEDVLMVMARALVSRELENQNRKSPTNRNAVLADQELSA